MATDDRQEYRFERLTQENSIRVLYLFPGERDDPLSGRLFPTTLEAVSNNLVSYEALSYEWGSPNKTCPFRLGTGRTIWITESLHDALRDLRYDRKSNKLRAIWADGICINQGDTQEVEQQVAIMGEVYRKAVRVVTYTGPERDGSSMAIEFARYLFNYAISRRGENSDPRLHSTDQLEELGLPPISDPRWPALRTLLLRGWASRCWCAHEFLLNRNLILMAGRVELHEWNLLPNIVELVFARRLPIYLLPGPVVDPYGLAECLANLNQMREWIWVDERPFDLGTLLQFSHSFRATNPRDKVYSILGLAHDRQDFSLRIDYDRPVASLYTKVASRIFYKTQNLSLLDDVLFPKSVPELPSWVPDWSTCEYGYAGVAEDEIYSAAGSTFCKIRVHPSENRLEVAGSLVARLTNISSPILPHYRRTDPVDTPARQRWLKEQQEFVNQLGSYPTGEDPTDVLWRTLLGNLTAHHQVAGNNYRAYYDAHFRLGHDSSAKERRSAMTFIDSVRRKSRSRRLAALSSRHLGAVPLVAREGDYICMFHGARQLFVVREAAQRGQFEFVGSAYVHGLMDGEVLDASWYREEMISLV
ncbi:ankyrin and HET domain-protein [Cladorrhinum samala]|uniref:Ankyrin and HET domain-protein n=1 Tax=Cladorrhinum samala TaxID=585594 RepID=A0AAV9HSE4_9PEZI|nr:ankyrin and HET domain-protein [Cladorrhinum samala]